MPFLLVLLGLSVLCASSTSAASAHGPTARPFPTARTALRTRSLRRSANLARNGPAPHRQLDPLRLDQRRGNPTPTPEPTPPPSGNCDPAYPTVCNTPPPPDLDCSEFPTAASKCFRQTLTISTATVTGSVVGPRTRSLFPGQDSRLEKDSHRVGRFVDACAGTSRLPGSRRPTWDTWRRGLCHDRDLGASV